MVDGTLGAFVRAYLDRVVNNRDLSGVDELVSPDYTGSGQGWPAAFDSLRQFYALQAVERPDWHIHVDATLELADIVVVRAHAGGSLKAGGEMQRKDVEWLASYRVDHQLVREISLLAFVEL